MNLTSWSLRLHLQSIGIIGTCHQIHFIAILITVSKSKAIEKYGTRPCFIYSTCFTQPQVSHCQEQSSGATSHKHSSTFICMWLKTLSLKRMSCFHGKLPNARLSFCVRNLTAHPFFAGAVVISRRSQALLLFWKEPSPENLYYPKTFCQKRLSSQKLYRHSFSLSDPLLCCHIGKAPN